MTRTGRPLRAMGLLLAVLAGWLLGRLPALRGDYAAALAGTAAPLADASGPAAAPVAAASSEAPLVTPVDAAPPAEMAGAEPWTGGWAGEPMGAWGTAPPPGPAQAQPQPIHITVNLPSMMTVPAFAPPPVPADASLAAVAAPAATGAPSTQTAAAAPVSNAGFEKATQAYAALSSGDRRLSAALFDEALAESPGNAQWQRDRRRLGQRWSGEAFSLLRQLGPVGPTASPVLGGGQTGGVLSWTLDPYARRPLAVVARGNVASDIQGALPETGQAALGVRWTVTPGVSISAERLFALGFASRNGWTLRGAAGGRTGRFSGYGEAGIIDNGDIYAGGQAYADVWRTRYFTLAAGAWGSLQTGDLLLGRFDIGPSLSGRIGPIRVVADWRFRMAGNADPGSGPALTVSAGF